jgi:hypothetical protein
LAVDGLTTVQRVVSARAPHESFTPVWRRSSGAGADPVAGAPSGLVVCCFPDLVDVPIPVVDHVRGYLDMSPTRGAHARLGRNQAAPRLDDSASGGCPTTWNRCAAGRTGDLGRGPDAGQLRQPDQHRDSGSRCGPGWNCPPTAPSAPESAPRVNTGFRAPEVPWIGADERGGLAQLFEIETVTRRSGFDELTHGGGHDVVAVQGTPRRGWIR